MPPSLSPHDTLFVPTAAGGLRRGPLLGGMIMGGALALIIASFLPWHVISYTKLVTMVEVRSRSTVLDAEGRLTLLLGALVFIAGLTLLKRPTQAARLFAGMGGVMAAGIGGNYVRKVLQEATAPRFDALGSSLPVYTPGAGIFVLGFGVLLILAGVGLWRPIP